MATPEGGKNSLSRLSMVAGIVGMAAACSPEVDKGMEETTGQVTQALTANRPPCFANSSNNQGAVWSSPDGTQAIFGERPAGSGGEGDLYLATSTDDWQTCDSIAPLISLNNSLGSLGGTAVNGNTIATTDNTTSRMHTATWNNGNPGAPTEIPGQEIFTAYAVSALNSDGLYYDSSETGNGDIYRAPGSNLASKEALIGINTSKVESGFIPYPDGKATFGRDGNAILADYNPVTNTVSNETSLGATRGIVRIGDNGTDVFVTYWNGTVNAVGIAENVIPSGSGGTGGSGGMAGSPSAGAGGQPGGSGGMAGSPSAGAGGSPDGGMGGQPGGAGSGAEGGTGGVACQPNQTRFRDADGDNFGDRFNTIQVCPTDDTPGYVTIDSDCDDTDGSINPGAPEVCDGEDNNCDTLIDENNPGGGAACNTGFEGVCADGTFVCDNGSLTCDQNVAASGFEICVNGVDDDCDGDTDGADSECAANGGSGSGGTGGAAGVGGSPEGGMGGGPVEPECAVEVVGDGCSVDNCDALQEGGAVEMNSTSNAECTFTITENGEVTLVLKTTGPGFSSFQPYSFYLDHDEWDIDHLAGPNFVYEYESEFGGTVWGGVNGTHIRGQRGMMSAGFSGVRMSVLEGSAWMGIPPLENLGEVPSRNVCISVSDASAGESIEITDQEITDALNPGTGGAGGEGGMDGFGGMDTAGTGGTPEGDAGANVMNEGGEGGEDAMSEGGEGGEDAMSEGGEGGEDAMSEGGEGGEDAMPEGDAGANVMNDGGSNGCSCSTVQDDSRGQIWALLGLAGIAAARRRRKKYIGIEAK